MATVIHDAHYRNEILDEFRFNPLIEALPAPFEPGDAIARLMIRPPYSDSDRECPSSYRQLLTQRIVRLHQPMEREVDVFSRIDRCIRWGYADRSPLSPSYAAQLAAGMSASVSCGSLNYSGGCHPHTYGFSILGISGIGKSTTVESILSLYPQVIRHTEYRGIPLVMHQVSWLKIDCSCDGSLKGLCMDFFRGLDDLLGTSYSEQYSSRRATLDRMMIAMSRLCVSHNVGLLIIDEIQNLCSAQKGVPEKVLNFFVTLVNTIGVPVIMIGTPKALSILQNEFQQAKRGSGQGDALWERMHNDASWELFCRAVWTYQYTKKRIPFTSGMKDALYEEAQGIPFLAVHIYKLVQEDAILSGKESFSEKDLHRIASEKIGAHQADEGSHEGRKGSRSETVRRHRALLLHRLQRQLFHRRGSRSSCRTAAERDDRTGGFHRNAHGTWPFLLRSPHFRVRGACRRKERMLRSPCHRKEGLSDVPGRTGERGSRSQPSFRTERL